MEFINDFNILDCPSCGGAGCLCEEGGCAFTIQCCDCGSATAPAYYKTQGERFDAAKAAVDCWNIGKIVYTGPGD